MALTFQTSNAPWLHTTPPDWQADRLKDIVPRILGGGTPQSSDPDCWEDGDIVWVTPTDFSRSENCSEISDSERKITRKGLNSSAATLLPQGTVIMASRATIGTVRLAGTELTTNQGFISFVCDERKLHRRFLYYVISSFLGEYFAEIAPGTTFQEISRGKAKLEPIGYPPLTEQQRIAAYLDASCATIDAAVAAKRRQLETLDALRKSIIHSFFSNQSNASNERVKDVAARITSGVTPEGGASGYLDSGIPLLRSQNVHFDGLRLDDVAFISAETHAGMSGSQVKSRDVLLNITGASIGRCTFVPDGFGEGNVNQHVCIIRPGPRVDHRFLAAFLSSPMGQDQILSTFTGASRQGLSHSDLGLIRIPFPKLHVQQEVVVKIEQHDGQHDQLHRCIDSQIATLTAYRKSLIHECVTGQRRITEADVVRSQLSAKTGHCEPSEKNGRLKTAGGGRPAMLCRSTEDLL